MNAISTDILQFLKSRGFLDGKSSLNDHESLTETGVIDSIGLLPLVDYLEGTYKNEIPLELNHPARKTNGIPAPVGYPVQIHKKTGKIRRNHGAIGGCGLLVRDLQAEERISA